MAKNKELKKGAYFTDIHFGRKANSTIHNQDCLNYIDWFCKKTIENECDYIAFLGDWHENRSALNILTLQMSYDGAKKLNSLGLPIYFVVGNHDLYYRNSRNIHSVIHHSEFNNFTMIDTPTVINDIYGTVLFCPYLFHEEYSALKQYLTVPFWAGHFEFKGFIITGYNVELLEGPDSSNFKGPKHIVSGHFHKRQTKPGSNVVYIGNAFPADFGDAGDRDRGMMVYDHVKDDMKFENWEDCPKYVRTTLSTIIKDEDKQNAIFSPQARVNCLVDIPLNFEESTNLHQYLMDKHNLRELNLEESPELNSALIETDADINYEELQTVEEIIIFMLQEIKTDHIDNELLVKLYKNITTKE
jgi:DNA repair exonuclease SbcCD nuclease subunit